MDQMKVSKKTVCRDIVLLYQIGCTSFFERARGFCVEWTVTRQVLL
jgi:hypothetical protein